MQLELEVKDSIESLPSGLFAELEGPSDYPFLRREWLVSFERSGSVGADRGWIPRPIVIRHRSARGPLGDVVAVLPAYLKLHSMGEFVFDQGWAEFAEGRLGVRYYPKLVIAVPFTPATGPRVLFARGLSGGDRERVYDAVADALPALAKRLGLGSAHVLFPCESDGAALEARGFARRYGFQYQFHNPGYATFDDFLGTFRAKRRAAIRRESRTVREGDVVIDVRSGGDFTREDARRAHALYLTTVDKYVWGRRYLTEAFFEEVFREMPDALHFVTARRKGDSTSGRPIAGAFNLLGTEALYGRYWGAFEEVPFLHFEVCLYQGIAETIRLGRRRFEPGAGGEHKEGRGFRPTLTTSLHHLADAQLDRAVRDFLDREKREVFRHVERSAEEG